MYRDFGNGCSCKGNGLWDVRMGKQGGAFRVFVM